MLGWLNTSHRRVDGSVSALPACLAGCKVAVASLGERRDAATLPEHGVANPHATSEQSVHRCFLPLLCIGDA